MANKISDTLVAKLEKQLGRKLSQREILLGELDREPLSNREQFEAANWKPTLLADPNATSVDKALAEVQKRVDQESLERRLGKMTPAERQLYILQESQAKELAARKPDPTVTRLKEVKPLTDKLQKLRDEAALNPAFTRKDLVALDQTIAQVSAVGADPTASVTMLQALDAMLDNKEAARVADIRQKASALGIKGEIEPMTRVRFAEALKKSATPQSDNDPAPEPEPQSKSDIAFDAWKDAMNIHGQTSPEAYAAFDAYKAVKAEATE
jgi:hypothetical protein